MSHSKMLPATVGAALAWAVLACPAESSAQIAFQPVVSAFPNGVTFPVTPVVTADRRYVRLTLSPQFNALEGFDTYSVPGAVSGGGAMGGGGLGGGLGGAGGGGGGGNGGGRLAAGMDGVMPDGFGRQPLLAAAPFAGPDGFADRGASDVLSGVGGRFAPPRLSAGMPDDGPRSRAKAPRRRGLRPAAKAK